MSEFDRMQEHVRNMFTDNRVHRFNVKTLPGHGSFIIEGDQGVGLKILEMFFGTPKELFANHGYLVKTGGNNRLVLLNYAMHTDRKWAHIWK